MFKETQMIAVKRVRISIEIGLGSLFFFHWLFPEKGILPEITATITLPLSVKEDVIPRLSILVAILEFSKSFINPERPV